MADDSTMGLPAIQSFGALAPNDKTFAVLASYLNTATRPKGFRGTLEIERPITKEDRAILTGRHKQISDHLLKFNKNEVAAAVTDAISSIRGFIKPDENPRHVVAKYVKELQGIPTWACVRACNAIRMGQAPGISHVYPFSTIQLRVLADSYVSRLREEAGQISEVLRASVAPQPQSPEVQAKVKTQLERLAFRLGRANRKEIDVRAAHGLEAMREANQRSILGEYARKGEEPKYTAGMLISPQLVQSVKRREG